MKAKVLTSIYSDRSGYDVIRVYFEPDFVQADKDLSLLQTKASDSKEWKLCDVEVFNEDRNTIR